MSEGKTLKEIALELLEKYRLSETGQIWEMSGSISEDTAKLEDECNYIRKQIEGMAEPKKGRWDVEHGVFMHDNIYGDIYRCSVCGYRERNPEGFNYCPHCGAKMEVTE